MKVLNDEEVIAMTQNRQQRLSTVSYFWKSGNYVLYCQKNEHQHRPLACMIYNVKERLFVRVEDDALYEALKQRMKLEGVPIVEELPSGKSPQQLAQEQFAELDIDDFNEAYEEIIAMLERGKCYEAIEKRIDELRTDYMNKLPEDK